MANDNVLNTILGFFGDKPEDAGRTVSLRKKYNEHVVEAQSAGREPMTFEEFKKKHGG